MKFCCLIITISTMLLSQLCYGNWDETSKQIKKIDLLIEGDHIVTMDGGPGVLQNGSVAIHEGLIVDVGKSETIKKQYKAKIVLEGQNKIVMPGLINGHSHAAMTLFRGIADDYPLFEWLNNYIFPAEVAFVDKEFVAIGTELACWEMIRGGTTTFVDMYYFPDTISRVVDSCGLRALVSATIIDQASPDASNAKDSLAKGEIFIRKWKGKSRRVMPILGPHSNYTLNLDQLKVTRSLAEKLGVSLSIHMSESMFENQQAKSTYNDTSINVFESINFLTGPTIAAHVVWPSDGEIQTLKKRNVGVIYNPTSNMKTGAGIAPIIKMLNVGINVGLGTDGAASNNDLDMWEEMRLAALLQKINNMDPAVLPAKKVLEMATIDGAAAIGLSDLIGSIEVGKRADLIQVSTEDVHYTPTYDITSHLVYVSDEQDVTTVVVDGKVLMKDREIFTIQTTKVKEKAARIAAKIKNKLIK
ncbi:MAG: amidohydrolase [Pseudomonadota bacterium]|nr:amidohydrolase [Pseudomonadota bacterium]